MLAGHWEGEGEAPLERLLVEVVVGEAVAVKLPVAVSERDRLLVPERVPVPVAVNDATCDADAVPVALMENTCDAVAEPESVLVRVPLREAVEVAVAALD